MPSHKSYRILFSLALAIFLAGCSGPSDDLDNASEEGNQTQSSKFENGLFMTIQTLDKKQGTYDKATVIDNPDEAEVKKQFQSLNWTDPDLRPSIKFSRTEEGKLISMFAVRRHQETAEGEITAEWISKEKKEYAAPKIDSLETALNLLLLFHGDKPELEKAVEWQSLN